MKAKEVMQKNVKTLRSGEKVREALEKLFKMRMSGLPVVDAQGKLEGMFTEKDVLKQVLPSYLEKVGQFVYEEDPKSIIVKFKDLQDVPIEQVMRKEVITVGGDVALCEVARLMITQKIRRIPVVGEDKKVIGIISREDVARAYAGQAGWKTE